MVIADYVMVAYGREKERFDAFKQACYVIDKIESKE